MQHYKWYTYIYYDVLYGSEHGLAVAIRTGSVMGSGSTGAQAGEDERRLFVHRPAGLERQVGYFLADPSGPGHLVPPVPVQVGQRRPLVHQPQDVRLVRVVDGRNRYVPDRAEPTAVVQVLVLQAEKIPNESPVEDAEIEKKKKNN